MKAVRSLRQFNIEFQVDQFIHEVEQCPDEPIMVKQCWGLVKPVVYWREAKIIEKENHQVMLAGGLLIESAYVARGLAQCEKAIIMAVTLGRQLPAFSSEKLQQGELYLGTIADLVGSHGVEKLAESFTKYLERTALAQGYFGTLRYSPGYGDWALSDQPKIMEYLEQCQGEISVTENYLLEPVKSITAIVGWSRTYQQPSYPVGDKKKGFCSGGHNCAACTTWACRK